MVKIQRLKSHPKLSVDGDHGEEQDNSQRAPEIRIVPHHLSIKTQRGHGHQHTPDLIVDVL